MKRPYYEVEYGYGTVFSFDSLADACTMAKLMRAGNPNTDKPLSINFKVTEEGDEDEETEE